MNQRADNALTEIEYTVLRNRHDLSPSRVKTSWPMFVELFRAARSAGCSTADCAWASCTYKDGAAWSPAVYPEGALRQRHHVEAVTMLAFDFEHMTDDQLAQAVASLGSLRSMVHATHSDRPGDRCARVVIALSRPVTRDEWKILWRAGTLLLKRPADPTGGDVGRIYYMPSRPADSKTYYFEVRDGRPLDVDALLALTPTTADKEIAR